MWEKTIKELKEIARANNVSLKGKTRKADIIETLELSLGVSKPKVPLPYPIYMKRKCIPPQGKCGMNKTDVIRIANSYGIRVAGKTKEEMCIELDKVAREYRKASRMSKPRPKHTETKPRTPEDEATTRWRDMM